jgi:protein TonB
MTRRMLAAAVLLFVIFVTARCRAQANEVPQMAATAAPPEPAQKILEKDPEFTRLLTPPAGDDFLQTYSQGYREKTVEIETRIANISDENLRSQTRSDEWSRVPKKDRDKFKAEAEVSYYEAKIAFLQNHRGGLFEVGQVTYDEKINSLEVKASPAAAIETNFLVAMNIATINQVYEKFRRIAAQEIDEKAREYVSKAGVGSMCSRNTDWCYMIEKETIEKSLRSARLVVVAQGDLEAKRIDRLLLVDYDTEAVFLELPPHISTPNDVAWRFSTELAPTVSSEVQSPDTQAQSIAPAPAEGEPSPAQHTEGTGSGNISESGSNPPTSSTLPTTRIRLPGKVTAASIVTQPPPQYPSQARAGHIQGDVVLHAIIDKEGKTSEVQVLSGDDLLAQSALEAVRQWRYRPLLVDGEPTEVDTTITVTFSLTD